MQNIPIFRQLTPEELEKVKKIIKTHEYRKDELIFSEDSPGNVLFIIIEGSVEITKLINAEKGTEKLLGVIRKGDFFGEMVFFDEGPRSATARAVENSKFFTLTKADFEELTKSDAPLANKLLLAILNITSPRLRHTDMELIFLYETGKIIGKFSDLKEMLGEMLNIFVQLLRGKNCLILIYSDISKDFELKRALNLPQSMEQVRIKKGEGLVGLVNAEKMPIIINNLASDERLRNLSKLGFESERMLLVPLILQERAIGIIVLGRDLSQEKFNLDDQGLLVAVASQIANAVENARLHEEAKSQEKLKRHYVQY